MPRAGKCGRNNANDCQQASANKWARHRLWRIRACPKIFFAECCRGVALPDETLAGSKCCSAASASQLRPALRAKRGAGWRCCAALTAIHRPSLPWWHDWRHYSAIRRPPERIGNAMRFYSPKGLSLSSTPKFSAGFGGCSSVAGSSAVVASAGSSIAAASAAGSAVSPATGGAVATGFG